ncbi:uncharacterized protein LOC128886306 isoform X1 [Hylaeus anthracinus]|uniref:uncharacterized protein LOC128886306 isoform X1 n=1 Tax=Hylaeus anthracinus TaxID=313031 RepID=UPI0023B8A5D8|nr:uncharacterized protein LOC128886306 isoform X1 [Hylaeus anthracinus]XP_053996990.1 uncharacterized protein LOC128886306 isoform X1 [Hylaeus anthracinus]XP_053996991.1 uncharacterized protein LOC128886306 isoform X1 [Hylaeus anthracinus]XP_053996992.1 uncharacterized protein LOC128886306 isoform X1 [Hylaeus anthracinus]XP_053996993.1 uncharacterized protein LOC128886306 isoform X1 [Hylaeus anthracinus]
MSRMLRLELVGFVLLACTQILTEHRDLHQSRNQYGYQSRYHESQERVTKDVRMKYGRLRGTVVQPRTNHNLQAVDVFLGVPYAEPPVRSLRFSPPRSPEPWRGVRQSLEFAPVCPQVAPKLRDEVKPVRYEYLEKLLPYLKNQSEDCLYLNIYAPHQSEGQKSFRKYPVIVFIHGESFEWNSGNPYDGTILAAYGKVVFVTINFRLGILGFLRPGIRDDTTSNFGLLDQIAALLWLKENIAEFGGDPNSITLLGHGTGAIFANLLLISPVANKKGLFKRAILMSGSALSADAIGKAPLQITKQVAHALNCPTNTDSDLALCLRDQDVSTLLDVKIHKPKYVPAFAPLIDNAVIPDKPLNLMKNSQLFGRFDLMYGVTESEKFHILPPVALVHGLLDGQRDEVLRDHAKATHELEPELVLSKILEQYGDFSTGFTNEYTTKNRDLVLEVLSDSGTVAPLIMTANLHSRANPKSYMYVFSHPKAMQDYSGQQRQHTVHGEELPYVLGVPLDGNKYDLRRQYNIGEALFSEAIMTWWSSFAYVGNPNVVNRYPYLTDGLKEWRQYAIEWPEYDPLNQTYLNLTIPPTAGSRYRSTEMQFWNEDLPNMLRHPNKDIPLPIRPKGPRPEILDIADGIGKYANASTNKAYETQGIRYSGRDHHLLASQTTEPSEDGATTPDFSSPRPEEGTIPPSTTPKSSSVITMLTGFGVVFLLINFTAFLYLYCRKQEAKDKEVGLKRRVSQKDDSRRAKSEKYENHYGELGYKSDSKPDLNDVIKNDKAYDNNSNFGRRSKLSRQNSGSTIDTHIKVREWIQQEIVHRCSPRFLRKTRETLQREHQDKLTKQQEEEKKRLEEEMLKEKKEEPIYDENLALVVRPGKKSKLPKVSVAIDATPATRTESILNQVPIELTKSAEPSDESFERGFEFQTVPQVVVIEHHHSKSDPLPMENVIRNVKPNFSTPRIYESDSGSASSLYAKINPKLKSRLPRLELGVNPEASVADEAEEIYIKTGPKLTTFGANSPPPCDINVTCREPVVERNCISPEEALRTIKRRNYPKVLPDIEKRRSLPAPSSLFAPKQYVHSLRDYRGGLHSSSSTHHPPQPPPRIFGPSKSLEFAEESENHDEGESVTTNLHVGPLLRRQDGSTKNNSDPSIIDSLDERIDRTNRSQAGGSVDTIYSNPMCPVHGIGQPISQSMDKNIGHPTTLLETGMGNPNWYKSPSSGNEAAMTSALSEPKIIGRETSNHSQFGGSNWDTRVPGMEPRIVITPRVGNLLGQANQNLSQTVMNLTRAFSDEREPIPGPVYDSTPTIGPRSTARSNPGSAEQLETDPLTRCISPDSRLPINTERKEPRIIITPRDPKGSSSNLKQPKIIIKPTSTLQRTRDNRNIPKVSAIPSPEAQCSQSSLDQREKPPLKEKPKITRIPSISRRLEDSSSGIEKPTAPVYAEKTEIVQRVEAVPSKVPYAPAAGDGKSSIPTFLRRDPEMSSSTDSSNGNSNTGTIKKKPVNRK